MNKKVGSVYIGSTPYLCDGVGFEGIPFETLTKAMLKVCPTMDLHIPKFDMTVIPRATGGAKVCVIGNSNTLTALDMLQKEPLKKNDVVDSVYSLLCLLTKTGTVYRIDNPIHCTQVDTHLGSIEVGESYVVQSNVTAKHSHISCRVIYITKTTIEVWCDVGSGVSIETTILLGDDSININGDTFDLKVFKQMLHDSNLKNFLGWELFSDSGKRLPQSILTFKATGLRNIPYEILNDFLGVGKVRKTSIANAVKENTKCWIS